MSARVAATGNSMFVAVVSSDCKHLLKMHLQNKQTKQHFRHVVVSGSFFIFARKFWNKKEQLQSAIWRRAADDKLHTPNSSAPTLTSTMSCCPKYTGTVFSVESVHCCNYFWTNNLLKQHEFVWLQADTPVALLL